MKRIVFSLNECQALLQAAEGEGYCVAELDDERVEDIDGHAEKNGIPLGKPIAWKANGKG